MNCRILKPIAYGLQTAVLLSESIVCAYHKD